MLGVSVQLITTETELEKAFEIRRKVFVEEQQVDALEEYDEFESISTHYLATLADEPVATCRWRKTPNGIKLERFAVLVAHRSSGVGSLLVAKCIAEIPATEKYLYLHAQLTAVGLYSKFGFVAEGGQFSEANILHYKMVLKR